jgi:nucleoside-diphosphate-sugar epimerase
MLAAAAGQPYRINFGGDVLYHFAPDAARAFIAAARAEAKQALSLNLGGTRASMARVVAAIERAAPEAAGLVTYDDAPLAVPSDVDAAGLEQLAPGLSHTPLDDGVAQTVDGFRRLLADGLVKPPGASSS